MGGCDCTSEVVFLSFFSNEWLGLSPLRVHASWLNVPLLPAFILKRGLDDGSEGEMGRSSSSRRTGGGKVSAGLPDASRQVSVHTVL